MFFTGLLYLLFEDTILKQSKSSGHAPGTISSLGSRVIMGMQVRFFPLRAVFKPTRRVAI
jgi:phosphatidylinositol glycan class N